MTKYIKCGGPEVSNRILVGLICSKQVLARLDHIWEKEGLLKSSFSNTIASLCFDYYRKYKDAPGDAIEDLVRQWGMYRGGRAEEELDPVERILEEIRDRYTSTREVNVEAIVDLASSEFSATRRRKTLDKLSESIERDEPEEYDTIIREYRRVPVGRKAAVDVLQDQEALKETFQRVAADSLIPMPGDLGKFFGRDLCRNAFVAFTAPEKRGKTWFLVDMACRSVAARKKTLLFEVGDLTQCDAIERIATRISDAPLYKGVVEVPTSIVREEGEARVNHRKIHYQDDLDWTVAWREFQRWQDRLKSKNSYFKLHTYPTGTLKVSQIEAICEEEAQMGFEIDTIVIDYADLLAPERHYNQTRDKHDEVWGNLRAMSSKLNCLVLTATQADASAYNQITMTIDNFSEDKRKNAHITGMIGINQTADEKARGIYRLNWLARRKGVGMVCHVASCLDLAQPCVCSLI